MSKHKKWISLILLVSLLLTIGARAETTLKLNGVSTKFSGDFAQRHPDVQLETGDYTYYATTGEMTSDMLLGSFNYDAFELSSNCIDYHAIMEKGYCLDLSGSEIIRSAIQNLHPVFAAQCMMDGKIYAIPHTMQINYLAFSPDALERSGMKDATTPTTFPEFLDFLERWIAYLKENPDCDVALAGMAFWGDPSFYDANSYTEVLVDELLENYMMQQEYVGESITFDEDVLVPLLERCYQIGHELYTCDPGVQTTYSILKVMQSTVNADYDLLSLRLNDTQPTLISVDINLYAVYAQTQYPELSIQLMEALCQNNWPMHNTYLYQNIEPLLNPQYDSEITKLQQMIQDTQQKLENEELEPSYREELEIRLEAQQATLQKNLNNENLKYLVTANDLEWFRSYVDYMVVPMPGLFHPNDVENANAFKQLKARFSAGQLSATDLIKELNRLAWMIEMEAM